MDHVLWAVPDLGKGIAEFAQLSGVVAYRGGRHAEHGTCNALLDMGDNRYLEILAPDKTARCLGPVAQQLRGLPKPRLLTFAVSAPDLNAVAATLATAACASDSPIAAHCYTEDAQRLYWRILFPLEPGLDYTMPFFID